MGSSESERVEYDLAVVGESAGGVVASIRASRLGLRTVLIARNDNPGGVFPSLGAVETHYGGVRSPLLAEIRSRIEAHYRDTYGAQSEQYAACVAPAPMIAFEPHVAENLLREMMEAERNLTVLSGYQCARVHKRVRTVEHVEFTSPLDSSTRDVYATSYIDATYTGDLVALAGVPFRVGRESRYEYGEPHAGRLFTRWVPGRFPREAADGRLNLLAKATTLGIYAGSSGQGDDNIMAYSYRLCLTDDPANRLDPPKPDRYDRRSYLGIVETPDVAETTRYALHHRFLTKSLEEMIASDHLFHGHALPNRKRSWNATNFPGAGKAYPSGDQNTRREIERAHLDHALGILYFLQHDEEVPRRIRMEAQKWGLARDEFVRDRNLPPQLYVREGRRMIGRALFTEHDAITVRDYRRPPVHTDSVAITDFPIDSLACTTERVPGCTADGQFFLQELSRPGQIPYGVLLPESIDNLLAPGAASVTHVAWGTVRQTPTFMHLAESAAWAVRVSADQGALPGTVPVSLLQHRLAQSGVMLTFFNDVDMGNTEPWLPAVQFLGTRGFFPDFDARANEPLTREVAHLWLEAAGRIVSGRGVDEDLPSALCTAEPPSPYSGEAAGLSWGDFFSLALSAGLDLDGARDADGAGSSMTRGDACRLIYAAVVAEMP